MPCRAVQVANSLIVGGPVGREDLEALLNDQACLEAFKDYALKNRLLLHALDVLLDWAGRLGLEAPRGLVEERAGLEKQYTPVPRLIVEVSGILEDAGVEHAVIKSIRPYRSTTVDIDVFVAGGREGFVRAYEALRRAGFRLFAAGPESATLETGYGVNLDLYVEVAASRIRYCPRRVLEENLVKVWYGGGRVWALAPELEFLLIAGHSLFKEHMFTLSDHLMLRDRLAASGPRPVAEAALAHGCTPHLLHAARMMRLARTRLDTVFPMKVGVGQLVAGLASMGLRSPWAREGYLLQLGYMLRPSRTREVLEYLVEHAVRETY